MNDHVIRIIAAVCPSPAVQSGRNFFYSCFIIVIGGMGAIRGIGS